MDFDKLYSKYNRLVREWVGEWVPLEDVEDVVQDVFLKVWKGFPEFRGEAKLKTWLYRVTHNHLVDLSRRGEIETISLNVGWDEDEEQDTPRMMGFCDENTPEMELSAEEMSQVLKPREEQCLRYYASGLDCGEIASLMGSTEGSVQVTISRAKQKLGE